MAGENEPVDPNMQAAAAAAWFYTRGGGLPPALASNGIRPELLVLLGEFDVARSDFHTDPPDPGIIADIEVFSLNLLNKLEPKLEPFLQLAAQAGGAAVGAEAGPAGFIVAPVTAGVINTIEHAAEHVIRSWLEQAIAKRAAAQAPKATSGS